MTDLDFLTEKIGAENICPGVKLISIIEAEGHLEEYEQIQGRIKANTQAKISDKHISAADWIKYNQSVLFWESKYKGKENSMEAGMSKPNEPNYFKANND
jgi:hypothetical protein